MCGLVGGEVGEEEVVVGGEEEVGSADVAVVDVEDVVDGVHGEHDLVDDPDWMGEGVLFYYSVRQGLVYNRS